MGLASGLGYSNEPFGSRLEGSEICTPRTLKPALPSAKARSTGRKVRPWLPCTSEMFKSSVSRLRGREFGFIAFGVAWLLGCRLRWTGYCLGLSWSVLSFCVFGSGA